MPSLDARTLRVRGYSELQRAFALASRELIKDLRSRLREIAEPVRRDAEQRASTEIRNIGPDWSQMRVGVTRRVVYVAPRERGVNNRRPDDKRRRPNLAPLLMDRAMSPALDANVGRISDALERMLDEIGRDWEHI